MSLEELNGPITAAFLVLLWSAEAVWPFFEKGQAPTQRKRHLVLGGLNAVVSTGVVAVLLLVVGWASARGIGLLRIGTVPWWFSVLVGFLILDFWQYAFHVTMHKVPLLWRFHAVHHNAERMEATTALRFHVGEILLCTASVIPLAVVCGLDMTHIVLYNLVLVPVSLFHHADIQMPRRADRWLRAFLVTPRMHWIHHSRWHRETDSNYSAVFSFWDRLFETFRTRRHPEMLEIGLDNQPPELTRTLRGMLLTPFSRHRPGLGETPPGAVLTPDSPKRARERTRTDDKVRRGADATA